MTTFSEMKFAMDEIARLTEANRIKIERVRTLLATVESTLASMLSKYANLVLDINSAATANPDDVAYAMLKSEKDKLVVDFQALKNYTTEMIAAFDAVQE